MTAQGRSYSCWSGGIWPSRLTKTVGARERSSGSCGGGRREAAVLCLVAVCSTALSVLENCSRKIFEGNSGESRNWPGKMSGELNTA
jgi:hypothetical protein